MGGPESLAHIDIFTDSGAGKECYTGCLRAGKECYAGCLRAGKILRVDSISPELVFPTTIIRFLPLHEESSAQMVYRN